MPLIRRDIVYRHLPFAAPAGTVERVIPQSAIRTIFNRLGVAAREIHTVKSTRAVTVPHGQLAPPYDDVNDPENGGPQANDGMIGAMN